MVGWTAPSSTITGTCSLCLCELTGFVSVDVDIEGAPDTDVTSKESGGTLDHPPRVHEIEALQKAVIGHMALELRQCPPARLGLLSQPVGKSTAEGSRGAVRMRFAHLLRPLGHSLLGMGPINMSLCLLQPVGGIGIAHELEEPS